MTTHGQHGTRLYRIWRAMRARCGNPNHPAARNYSERGITVCAQWAKFAAFAADVGQPPTDKHQLDRIDNERGYEPGNVRWATTAENARNKRVTRMITFDGITLCMTDWALRQGIGVDALYRRLARGLPLEIALRPGNLNATELVHGTRGGYEIHKCRCALCRAFNAERARKYKASKGKK